MKTIPIILISIFFLLLPVCITTAQVTIGDESEPNRGALLDLKESDSNNMNNANSTQGILLPRVNLTTTNLVTIKDNTNNLIGEEKIHVGMVVYNLKDNGTDLCEGPYVWNGQKWIRSWGDCGDCEYTVIGKDGKEYHIYCLQFITAPEQAASRCKQPDVTNPGGSGGYYTYHLMTADEYGQIEPDKKKGITNDKFSANNNHFNSTPPFSDRALKNTLVVRCVRD
ncbi:hypothetical protein [Prevotella sp. 10(H)]|uniref:hypothetical protein n=1 Tax=Prevotella sp. 10(H) TaxID=1158294 RepID=UPI0012DD24BD|nr:hypothetical protein [Prevotella sp. 10(H)]